MASLDRQSSMRRRAFTLVEVLVVLGIILVLAALLFPVFAQAKKRAKMVTCESHLRQVAVALNLYRIDNDAKGFVWAHYDGRGYRLPFNNFEPAGPYIKDGRLLWCPEPSGHPMVAQDFMHYRTWTETFPNDPRHLILRRPFAPEPGTVALFCANHTKQEIDPRYGTASNLRIGTYPFAREDTSVKRVPSGQIVVWYEDAQGELSHGWQEGNKNVIWQFPGEPWPLEKE